MEKIKDKRNKRIIIAITGASGAAYGVKALEILKKLDIETHLILSKSSHITIKEELKQKNDQGEDNVHE